MGWFIACSRRLPHARYEPRLKAGAQRTLEGIGLHAMVGRLGSGQYLLDTLPHPA